MSHKYNFWNLSTFEMVAYTGLYFAGGKLFPQKTYLDSFWLL